MATTGHTTNLGRRFCQRHLEVLSVEETALLHVLRSSGRPLDATEAAERTGMDPGLARLAFALLEDRGL
jgi:hypothetical protein